MNSFIINFFIMVLFLENVDGINPDYIKKIKHYKHVNFKHEVISLQESKERSDQFYKFLNKRRSLRFFSDREVPFEVIENIILTAGTAPSGAHKQPWTYVVIQDPIVKSKIREAAENEERISYSGRMSEEWLENLAPLGTTWEKPFLEEAPYLIVAFKQLFGIDKDGNQKKHYYVNESVGISVGFLIAAIHNAGLVTLTHTPSPMKFLSRVLERPDNESAFVLLPVGYPAVGATVPDLTRKNLNEIMVLK